MQEPTSLAHTIQNVVITIVCLGLVGWAGFRSLKRTEDPALLIFKWVLSLVVIGYLVVWVLPAADQGGMAAFVSICEAAVGGLVLTALWRRAIAGWFSKPFENLYSGGDTEIEPQAYYSVAEARRKRGRYTEAVAEIRKQLERFPTDVRGHMLLAEIQAENLNDLPGAKLTIQRFCDQPDHAPRNITFALNMLADWQLKYDLDREAAQQTLQKVIDLYPDTDMAHAATQRIAHLASLDRMVEAHDRPRVAVPVGVKYVGLMPSSAHLAPEEMDPEKQVEQLVQHLTEHPQEAEAREKLAILYADHFGRLDLAGEQLGQLIGQVNQLPKNVARWLNLLADLQVRGGRDYDTVRETLELIIERYPDHPAAQLAQNRIDTLKLELRAKDKNESVKMGTYEQYIGLKPGSPGTPS